MKKKRDGEMDLLNWRHRADILDRNFDETNEQLIIHSTHRDNELPFFDLQTRALILNDVICIRSIETKGTYGSPFHQSSLCSPV